MNNGPISSEFHQKALMLCEMRSYPQFYDNLNSDTSLFTCQSH